MRMTYPVSVSHRGAIAIRVVRVGDGSAISIRNTEKAVQLIVDKVINGTFGVRVEVTFPTGSWAYKAAKPSGR